MAARTAIEIITSITSLALVSNSVIDVEIFEEAKKDMVMSSESPSSTKRVDSKITGPKADVIVSAGEVEFPMTGEYRERQRWT